VKSDDPPDVVVLPSWRDDVDVAEPEPPELEDEDDDVDMEADGNMEGTLEVRVRPCMARWSVWTRARASEERFPLSATSMASSRGVAFGGVAMAGGVAFLSRRRGSADKIRPSVERGEALGRGIDRLRPLGDSSGCFGQNVLWL